MKEAMKFLLILASIILFIIMIDVLSDTFNRMKETYMNTEVTQQMSNECSKEADESVCD